MPLIAQSLVPAVAIRPAPRKPGLLARLLHAVAEAHNRTYLQAVTDPATGRIDPALEYQVLRMMAL